MKLLNPTIPLPLPLPLSLSFPLLPRFHRGLPLPILRRSANRGIFSSAISPVGGAGVVSGVHPMAAVAAIAAGEMIYHPILERGVFRFDCSADHRAAAFPSLSFADPKARETPVAGEGSPEFVPVFECVGGQQKVTVKVLG